MNEIWKIYKDTRSPHGGTGRLWEVSNLGRVKRNGELVTDIKKNTAGYYAIANFGIHKAVAELFIPNPENKPCVDHIDGNKLNNVVTNLRWVTYKENMNNPVTIVKIQGKNNGMYGKTHTASARQRLRIARTGSFRVYDNDEHTKWHMEKNDREAV